MYRTAQTRILQLESSAVFAAGHADSLMDGILLSQHCSREACDNAASDLDDVQDWDVPEVVLGMSSRNMFRAACIKITRHRAFHICMMICILASCVSMTAERPSLQEGSTSMHVLHRVNLVLAIVFALECGLKIITYNPQNYWSSHSNKIDAFIVFISFLLTAIEDSRFSALKSLRVLRALKAMRIATRSEAMKHQVALVIGSLASMVCTCLSCVLDYMVHAS